MDKQLIRDKLLSVWQDCDAQFQRIAHRRILNGPTFKKRKDLEARMAEVERVLEMLKRPNVAIDKLELEGTLEGGA